VSKSVATRPLSTTNSILQPRPRVKPSV
jgi:hypothetical protein